MALFNPTLTPIGSSGVPSGDTQHTLNIPGSSYSGLPTPTPNAAVIMLPMLCQKQSTQATRNVHVKLQHETPPERKTAPNTQTNTEVGKEGKLRPPCTAGGGGLWCSAVEIGLVGPEMAGHEEA